MKKIHQPIKDVMYHYAEKFSDDAVLSILKKEEIGNEISAKQVLNFLDKMCDQIAIDAKENYIILNQPVHTTDAEKICDVIEDYIEALGYDHLL
jgi:hypothetical protein